MENEEKELTSLSEYAKSHQISFEAVRKRVEKFKDDLEGHIIVENGTRKLDAFAVSFLEEKAGPKGRTVKLPSTTALAVPEPEALKTLISNLIDAMYGERIDTLTKERDEKASKCEDLTVKNTELKVENEYLVKEQGKLEEQNAELCKQIEQLKQELDQASKRKGFFGWFRK